MKLILLTDVKKVGQRGSMVTVADGYAQNVLLPKRLAVTATPENLKRYERERAGATAREALNTSIVKKTFADMNGKTVTLQARANETGGLFEAIHEQQIAEAVQKSLGISIPEEAITLEAPIKKTGIFKVGVSSHDASATLVIEIVKI
jgi:large subunit ribosomal protein L9